MKKPESPLRLIFAGLLLLMVVGKGQAQFRQLPVDLSDQKASLSGENLKIAAGPMMLPFWDDFSTGRVDSLKWENRGVTASKTIGINPPSIGVVNLDGVDLSGNPYSTSPLADGEGDQLLSRSIDLSSLNAADSLYLSFFWQAGGRGEMPDANDKLLLSFLDATGNWVPVWEVEGGDLGKREVFTQEMVLLQESFFHADFRFRFSNSGRLSGPFDSWLLDYIYLNKGRTRHQVYHEDRALTTVPNSPFGKYSALPLFELVQNKETYLTEISSQFNNLSNRFRAMEFTVELRDKESQRLIKRLHANTPFNPVPQALERRDFKSVVIKDIDLDTSREFDLETLVFLTTGDGFLIDQITGGDTTFLPSVDFRINDTTRNIMPIKDFMAYDNGSLDYAAGINQRSGMLALRYNIESPAYLKGLSINFANAAQAGSALELMVWDDLAAQPIYVKEVLIPEKERLEEFSFFELDTNLTVADTFYVGFTQFTNDFIYVGLDKSNDSGEEIFYNVAGSWEQNNEVRGSLMIRPHLTTEPVSSGGESDLTARILAYPNPVEDQLYLEGPIGEVMIFDAYGRQIKLQVEEYDQGKIINFVGSDKGVYVVRAWTGNKPNSIRILVK